MFFSNIFIRNKLFENIVAYRYTINITEYSSVYSFQYSKQKFIDKKTP